MINNYVIYQSNNKVYFRNDTQYNYSDEAWANAKRNHSCSWFALYEKLTDIPSRYLNIVDVFSNKME